MIDNSKISIIIWPWRFGVLQPRDHTAIWWRKAIHDMLCFILLPSKWDIITTQCKIILLHIIQMNFTFLGSVNSVALRKKIGK